MKYGHHMPMMDTKYRMVVEKTDHVVVRRLGPCIAAAVTILSTIIDPFGYGHHAPR